MSVSEKIAPMFGMAHMGATEFTSRVEVIGPEEAKRMLETMKYQHQRTVRRPHVAMLAQEMTSGRFVGATTIRIARLGNDAHLIDGQHRLSAVVLSGKSQQFTVVEEVAPSAEYIAWAYGNIDISKARTFADLCRPMELYESLGMTGAQINHLSAAIEVLAGGMMRSSKTKLSKADRARIVELYAPHMRGYIAITKGAPVAVARALRRSYVVAMAVLTLRFPFNIKGITTAQFWKGVAFNTTNGDPRSQIYEHLMTTSMRSDTGIAPRGGIATTAYGARFIANGYNNYTKGSHRKIKVLDDTAPVEMLGVPSDISEWLK